MRINDLASQLGYQGHEITVLTGKPNYPDGRLMEAYKKEPNKFNKYQ